MAEHSKEPWLFTLREVQNFQGSRVFDTSSMRIEDVRRILACVNACEGISTEVLEEECGNNAEPDPAQPPHIQRLKALVEGLDQEERKIESVFHNLRCLRSVALDALQDRFRRDGQEQEKKP